MGFFSKIGKAFKKVVSSKAFGIALGIFNPTALLANANFLQKAGVKVPFSSVLVPLSSLGQKVTLGLLSGGSLAGLGQLGGLAGNTGNLFQMAQQFSPFTSLISGSPAGMAIKALGVDPGSLFQQSLANIIAQNQARLLQD